MSSINAMLASKKAYHHFFQLHAVGCLFRMAYSMTCMNTILATPLSNVLNFHLNDDTGGDDGYDEMFAWVTRGVCLRLPLVDATIFCGLNGYYRFCCYFW